MHCATCYSVNEAVQLGAQFPMHYEGWKPAQTSKSRHTRAFFERVQIEMYPDLVEDMDTKLANVFTLWSRHVSAGEITDVKNCMLPDLRKLWN